MTVIDAASFETRTLPAAPLGSEGGLSSWSKPHYAALSADGTLLMAYKGVVLFELDPRSGSGVETPLRSGTHSQGVELTPTPRLGARGRVRAWPLIARRPSLMLPRRRRNGPR